MTYLIKEEVFFERNEQGELLPIDITLETLPNKPTIKATPLSKGELAEIVSKSKGNETDTDSDVDMIIKHCKEPLFTEEDKESLKSSGKTVLINAIALAILSVSTSTTQQELVEQGKKVLIEKELTNFRNQ